MAPNAVIPPNRLTLIVRLTIMTIAVGAMVFGQVTYAQDGTASEQDDLSSEPYVVFVSHESAYARCGPGGTYYRTDPLRHGQELDVYVETADGWLGVRPPANSFCWMPASAVEKNNDGETATVTEDKSVIWIGTHLGRARKYQWQIQLAEGESVTVIGQSERDGPDGPQLWYRIVPPSGEFRWVHRDQVVSTAEELIASVQSVAKTQRPKSDKPKSNPRSTQRDSQDADVQPASAQSSVLDRRELADDLVPQRDSKRRSNASPGLSRAEEPELRPAPKPSASTTGRVIGSGVRPDLSEDEISGPVTLSDLPKVALPEPVRQAVDAAARFVGQPRLMDIGLQNRFAPSGDATPTDSNWIPGTARASTLPNSLAPAADSTPVPAAGIAPAVAQVAATDKLLGGVSTAGAVRYVSPERITRVEDAIAGANLDELSLVFSRLMAEGATSEEVAPVLRMTQQLVSAGDPLQANRARELSQRIDRYKDVARRRDGPTIIQASAGASLGAPRSTPTITSPIQTVSSVVITPIAPAPAMASAAPMNSVPLPAPSSTSGPQVGTATGYLVQVYSSRPSSPPYALTSGTGETITYVTPYPGVNLRPHLNSEITIRGNQGFLQGVNTPHVLATGAIRTQRR